MSGTLQEYAFLNLLEKSQLFSESDFQSLKSELQQMGLTDSEGIAAWLVKQERLTRWQAQELLNGKHAFFLGHYRLLEKLGVGGRGVVYKAQNTGCGKIVAVKVLGKEFLKKPEAVKRFKLEAEVTSSFDHPNLVSAFDVQSVGRVHFLVMEYVAGQDVGAWLQQEGPLPIGWSSEVIRQAALGLAYAHDKEVIHRDIKPANLMVQGNDIFSTPLVKILDLGFARSGADKAGAERITQRGQVFGTPDYMSPEQAENTFNVDHRSDIYSLGCSLYRMLTGRFPFEGGTAFQKLMARTQHDAPLVRGLRKDVPEGLEALLAKMLQRDPAKRCQSAEEVAQAIQPYCTILSASESASMQPARSESLLSFADDEELESQRTLAELPASPKPVPQENTAVPETSSQSVSQQITGWLTGLGTGCAAGTTLGFGILLSLGPLTAAAEWWIVGNLATLGTCMGGQWVLQRRSAM